MKEEEIKGCAAGCDACAGCGHDHFGSREESDENVEVNILEIKEVDGEEVYDTVTDEELGKKVFEEFTKNQEAFDEE